MIRIEAKWRVERQETNLSVACGLLSIDETCKDAFSRALGWNRFDDEAIRELTGDEFVCRKVVSGHNSTSRVHCSIDDLIILQDYDRKLQRFIVLLMLN